MKRRISAVVLAALLPVNVQARSRSSVDYSIVADSVDAGGKHATSANYTNDGSIGGITGIATVAAPVEIAKSGYIGQLYEVANLTLAAAGTGVDETATVQLSASQTLDDLTSLAVPATSVTWSIASGPLTGIDANGLATAGPVYQDTAAVAQGAFGGKTATLALTVRDSLPDNYGSYAGDGIDDSWQNFYFGLNNPNAGPGMDPDGDGQNNLFEFTAGLDPTDPASRLVARVDVVPDQPGQMLVVFSPVVAGRSYVIETSADLDTWSVLTGATQTDSGSERSVTDGGATDPEKFYRVRVSKP
jgi:hypothetical protein